MTAIPPPIKRGVAAGRSAQRGTSGAATGGGGRSAPDPEYVRLLLFGAATGGGGRSAPDPGYVRLLLFGAANGGGGRSAPDPDQVRGILSQAPPTRSTFGAGYCLAISSWN